MTITPVSEQELKDLRQFKMIVEYIINTHPELRQYARAARVAYRLENYDGYSDTGL